MDEHEQMARHEAAHALVGYLLGDHCLDIKWDKKNDTPVTNFRRCDELMRSLRERRMLTWLAGNEAARLVPDNDDDAHVEHLACKYCLDVEEHRAEVRRMLAMHHQAISNLADVVLERVVKGRETLEGSEVRDIITRAIHLAKEPRTGNDLTTDDS